MNMTNGTLFTCSWVTAIVASITINLSPFWEILIKAAPWGSTILLYLINFDKVNSAIRKIFTKDKSKKNKSNP